MKRSSSAFTRMVSDRIYFAWFPIGAQFVGDGGNKITTQSLHRASSHNNILSWPRNKKKPLTHVCTGTIKCKILVMTVTEMKDTHQNFSFWLLTMPHLLLHFVERYGEKFSPHILAFHWLLIYSSMTLELTFKGTLCLLPSVSRWPWPKYN